MTAIIILIGTIIIFIGIFAAAGNSTEATKYKPHKFTDPNLQHVNKVKPSTNKKQQAFKKNIISLDDLSRDFKQGLLDDTMKVLGPAFELYKKVNDKEIMVIIQGCQCINEGITGTNLQTGESVNSHLSLSDVMDLWDFHVGKMNSGHENFDNLVRIPALRYADANFKNNAKEYLFEEDIRNYYYYLELMLLYLAAKYNSRSELDEAIQYCNDIYCEIEDNF